MSVYTDSPAENENPKLKTGSCSQASQKRRPTKVKNFQKYVSNELTIGDIIFVALGVAGYWVYSSVNFAVIQNEIEHIKYDTKELKDDTKELKKEVENGSDNVKDINHNLEAKS